MVHIQFYVIVDKLARWEVGCEVADFACLTDLHTGYLLYPDTSYPFTSWREAASWVSGSLVETNKKLIIRVQAVVFIQYHTNHETFKVIFSLLKT